VFTWLLVFPAIAFAEDPPKPISPAEAAKKVNETVTVSMLVKSTGGRENCYLNSEEDFNLAMNFTIFISKDAKEKLKKAGIENPAEYYNKKTIEVTGKVILFEGKKPRIPITEADQIKVVEKAKG
jgi:DNA/RNA endonuclease YhcR with UshA esterase domain